MTKEKIAKYVLVRKMFENWMTSNGIKPKFHNYSEDVIDYNNIEANWELPTEPEIGFDGDDDIMNLVLPKTPDYAKLYHSNEAFWKSLGFGISGDDCATYFVTYQDGGYRL